jgi:hypothetical protein
MTKSKQETPLSKCKAILEDFLLNSDQIPICSKSSTIYLDSCVARYLIKEGHEDFLVEDVSLGPQVGGVSQKALIDFAQEQKVFDGKSGRYKIKIDYVVHSARVFEAWPA